MEIPVDPAEIALLEGGELTAPQPPLPPNEEVPVAVWRDGPIGAILSIWHDPEDDDEPFAQEITVYEFVDGAWRWRMGGGSDWPFAYGERPSLERPVLTATGATTAPDDENPLVLASGIAPPGVHRIRIELEGFETEADVEPVTGAFLVGLPQWPRFWEVSVVR